jgi:hypothetical protein
VDISSMGEEVSDRLASGEFDPLVAAIDGEDGGPGDRVKYTTFASDPPI